MGLKALSIFAQVFEILYDRDMIYCFMYARNDAPWSALHEPTTTTVHGRPSPFRPATVPTPGLNPLPSKLRSLYNPLSKKRNSFPFARKHNLCGDILDVLDRRKLNRLVKLKKHFDFVALSILRLDIL